MTPATAALPPIITPPANSPMPTAPAQPASVGGCANTLPPGTLSTPGAAPAAKSSKAGKAKGAAKKGVAKVLGTKAATKNAVGAEAPEQQQEPWPSGIAEQDQDQTGSVQAGAWPSGISEK
jgi:hypothetical protein